MKRKIAGWGFALLFAVCGILPASAAVPSNPSQDVPDLLKGFDEFALKVMAEWRVPGLGVAVVKDGRLFYAEGFGYRDLERKLPVTPHTIFGIGSCSKAFTATTMGILVDEGKLDWDKPVRSYLPTFKLSDPVASERLTPRDLITHRTGLPRHDNVWTRTTLSRQQIFDALHTLEFSRDIRQVYQYNNLMVMTAGYLVGAIAGTSWEDFARSRIIEPLGMTETDFSTDDSQKAPDFSRSYRLVGDKIDEFPFYNADALGPAGSINSSVADMARWLTANLNKGKYGENPDQRIISERTLAQIHAPQVVVPDIPRYPELFYASYGMGWRITAYRGHLQVHHSGSIMGFSAGAFLFPRDGFGVILLNNLEDAPINTMLADYIIDRLLGLEPVDWYQRIKEEQAKSRADSEKRRQEREQERKPGTVPSHPASDYAGEYEHPAYGTIAVTLAGNELSADYHQRQFTLGHYHYDVFTMRSDWMDVEYRVTFVTDLQGRIASLLVPFESSVKDIVFVKKGVPAGK